MRGRHIWGWLSFNAGIVQAYEKEEKVVEAFDDFSRVLQLESANRCKTWLHGALVA